MKILYAIQGTGNGHVCRAKEIVPILQKKASVDILISGTQSDISLPFTVKYNLTGLSFIFGKNGGVDLLQTYKKSRLRRLISEIKSLPVDEYDLVISDFEPVSAWACYLNNKPCISLSHQSAVLNKKAPQPSKTDPMGKAVLKAYAPSSVSYGFHFKEYAENIFTPVIRKEVRNSPVGDAGHYTVYLPAYSDKRILKMLSRCKGVKWEVFSKHFQQQASIDNVDVFPLNNDNFIMSMASAKGVLCGAGFETPAEALYLKKKLLVIPMKNQYEQHCNAAALKEMGVPVMKSLKEKHLRVLQDWLISEKIVPVSYPDTTEQVIDGILAAHGANKTTGLKNTGKQLSVKDLKTLTFKKILYKMAN